MLERIKKGSRSLHMHPAKGPRRLHMHPAKTLSKALTTPPSAELTAKVNEKSLPQEQKREASITEEGPEGKKGSMLVTPHLMTKPKEGRSRPSKQLFTPENRDNVDASNDASRTEVSK